MIDASDVGSNDDGPDPPHLTRVDSAQSVRTEDPPMARDESDAALECCNVPLLFGINHYTLTVQVILLFRFLFYYYLATVTVTVTVTSYKIYSRSHCHMT